MEIGDTVYDISPLPLRFVVGHGKQLDRFKLPPLAPGVAPEEGDLEPMTEAERFEFMYQGLVASIRRKQPGVNVEKLADDLDHESIVRAWVVVMENSTVRQLLKRVEPGKERPVLTAQAWDAIQEMTPASLVSTGQPSSPESSPVPAGISSTSSTK